MNETYKALVECDNCSNKSEEQMVKYNRCIECLKGIYYLSIRHKLVGVVLCDLSLFLKYFYSGCVKHVLGLLCAVHLYTGYLKYLGGLWKEYLVRRFLGQYGKTSLETT